MFKVALITNILAHYRLPCFIRLFEKQEKKINFFFLTKEMPHRDYVFSSEQPTFPAFWLKGWRWRMPPYDDRHLNDIRPFLKGRYDIVIMGGWDEPTYLLTWLIYNITGKKILFWIESTAYESLRSGIREIYKKFLLKHAAGCIVPGTRSYEYCLQLGMAKERIFIAPNATDREYFSLMARRLVPTRQNIRAELGLKGPVILFVGRLVEEHKNVSVLIKSFGNLSHATADISLLIAGEGPDRLRYESFVRGQGITGVRFLGKLAHDQLCRIYTSADILVLPSKWEPWGFVLNEGMEFGLPLVVSNAVGAGPDLVREGKNGFVFPAGNVDALSEILSILIRDEPLRARMGKSSMKIIEEYSPENWAEGVMKAISTVTKT